jgi:hypothetical protein
MVRICKKRENDMLLPGDVLRNVKLYSVKYGRGGSGCFKYQKYDCTLKQDGGKNFIRGEAIELAICQSINQKQKKAVFIIPTSETILPARSNKVLKNRWKELADKPPQVKSDKPDIGLIFIKKAENSAWEMAVHKHPLLDYLPGEDRFGPFSLITPERKNFPIYRTLGSKLPDKYQGTLDLTDGNSKKVTLILHGFGNAIKLHHGVLKHFIDDQLFFADDPFTETSMTGYSDLEIKNICRLKCFDEESKLQCWGEIQPETNNFYHRVQHKLADLPKHYQKIFFTIFQWISNNPTGGKVMLESTYSSTQIRNCKEIVVKAFVPSDVICHHSEPFIVAIMEGRIYRFRSLEAPLVIHLNCRTVYPISEQQYQRKSAQSIKYLGEISNVQRIYS